MSTTLVKKNLNHGTFDEEWKKKISLLPTIVINRLERNCEIFKRWGGKNPSSSTTLGQFAQKKKYIFNLKKTNNDHGVDVSIILVI